MNGLSSSGTVDERSVRSLTMTTEVCRCCGAAATLEGRHSHLVLDSVLNGQPMQLTQQWLDMRSSWTLENDPDCIVLHSL